MLQRTLDECVDLVTGAAFAEDGWQVTLDQLARSLPGTKLTIHVEDELANKNFGLLSSGLEEKTIRDYASYYHTLNPWTPYWLRTPTLAILDGDAVVPQDTLLRSEFYNDLLRREGDMNHAIGVKIFQEGERFAGLSAYYGDSRFDDYSVELDRVLKTLAPHLRMSLQLARYYSTSDRLPVCAADLLAGISAPACLVSDTQKLLAGNQPFWQALANGQGLRLDRSDCVRPADSRFDRRFAAMIRNAAAARSDGGHPTTFEVAANAKERVTITFFRVRSMVTSIARWLWNPANQILVVVGLPAPVQNRLADARSHFGLTPAEARLAVELTSGCSLADCAQRLGVTYETARSYLRVIFSKTGTHRQGELVALLALTLR